MKLHEIKANSTIYVAKLPENFRMDTVEIKDLDFKQYKTKETTAHFAEWVVEINSKRFSGFKSLTKWEQKVGIWNNVLKFKNKNIECYENGLCYRASHNLVFSRNEKKEFFVAIVDVTDMKYYVNIEEGE